MGSVVKTFFSPAVKPSTYDWLQGNDNSFAYHVGSPHFALIAARTTILFAASVSLIQHHFKMPMTIFSATCLAGGWIIWEHRWFIQAVRKAALEIYATQTPVPSSTVTYLANDPEAIETLISSGGNLQKRCAEEHTGAGKKSLLKTLVQRTHVSARTEEIWFKVFKLLAHVPNALDAEDLKWVISWHSYSGCAAHALEQNLVPPSTVAREQETILWRAVRDFLCIRLLSEKFSVQQAARIKLRDWLIGALGLESVGTLCHLLSLGAESPSLDEEFNYRSEMNVNDPKMQTRSVSIRRTLKSLRNTHPELIAVIEQAHEPGQNSAVPDEQARVGSKGPLVNTMLSQGKFEIAKNVIGYRMALVVVAVAVAVAAVALKILPWKLALCGSGLAALGTYVFESQRAKKHLRETALNVFKRTFPAHSVALFVAQDLSLVQQLTKKEVVKFDDHGYTLWDHLESQHLPNFEIFKLFADAMADKEPALKEQFFQGVVRSGHVKFVKYLLENQKIKVQEISDPFSLWICLNDLSVAKVLKSFGFNPEVKDKNGMTPLHWLLNHHRDLPPTAKRLRSLLVAGAKFDLSKVPTFNQQSSYIQRLCLGTNTLENIYQAIF